MFVEGRKHVSLFMIVDVLLQQADVCRSHRAIHRDICLLDSLWAVFCSVSMPDS